MARNGDFDDEEGFMENLMKRRGKVPMPDSMAKLLSVIAGLVVLVIISLVAWAVLSGDETVSEDSVPVIQAEEGDYKVAPDDAGGMPIPNKDSTVFETMDKSGETKVENLLDDSEQPMKKDEAFKEDANAEDTPSPTPIPDESELADAPKGAVKDSPKVEAKEEVKAVEKKVEEKPAIIAEKKPNVIDQLKAEAGTKKIEPVKAKPKPKEKPVEKKAVVSKGSTYIQLAAVRSEADAKAKWAALQGQYPSLKGLSLRVNKADLGAKGVFYRVQAGGVSADSAASLCAKIKSAGGGCMIVK